MKLSLLQQTTVKVPRTQGSTGNTKNVYLYIFVRQCGNLILFGVEFHDIRKIQISNLSVAI